MLVSNTISALLHGAVAHHRGHLTAEITAQWAVIMCPWKDMITFIPAILTRPVLDEYSRREPAKSQRSDCGSELPRESWTEIYHRSSVTFVVFYWAIVKKMHCLIIRRIIMLMVISYNRRGFKSTDELRIRIQNSSEENWRPQKIPGESFPHHVQIMLCWLRGDGHEKEVNEREKLLESRAKEENRGGKEMVKGETSLRFHGKDMMTHLWLISKC